MTATNTTLQRIGADRGIALFNYALLFASVFLMGLTGLAAVIVAYATRAQASPGVRRHLNAQIGIFWTAVLLTLVAVVLAVVAVVLLITDVWRASPGPEADPDVWKTVTTHFSLVSKDPWLAATALGAAITGVATLLFALVAPAIGFVRLATSNPKGVTAET
jgi:uncharacterized membrane protein